MTKQQRHVFGDGTHIVLAPFLKLADVENARA